MKMNMLKEAIEGFGSKYKNVADSPFATKAIEKVSDGYERFKKLTGIKVDKEDYYEASLKLQKKHKNWNELSTSVKMKLLKKAVSEKAENKKTATKAAGLAAYAMSGDE